MKIITKIDNNVTLTVQQTLRLKSVINQLIAEEYRYLGPEDTLVISIQEYITAVYEEDYHYHWYTVDNYGLNVNEYDIEETEDGEEIEYCSPYTFSSD